MRTEQEIMDLIERLQGSLVKRWLQSSADEVRSEIALVVLENPSSSFEELKGKVRYHLGNIARRNRGTLRREEQWPADDEEGNTWEPGVSCSGLEDEVYVAGRMAEAAGCTEEEKAALQAEFDPDVFSVDPNLLHSAHLKLKHYYIDVDGRI